jgi:hypothetical protein
LVVSKKLPIFCGNIRFSTIFYRNASMMVTLNQTNPVLKIKFCFLKNNINVYINVQFMSSFLKWSLAFILHRSIYTYVERS